MKGTVQWNFSHPFEGVVWSTVALPERSMLILEVRRHAPQQVTFSALNYETNTFLWKDRILEESWWVNLSAAAGDILLFTLYLDTNNPDKKGIAACDLDNLKLLWWNNDFSFTAVQDGSVYGVSSKTGFKHVVLDLRTGKEVLSDQDVPEKNETEKVLKPMQYTEGMPYFETVKTFFNKKLNLFPVTALEYVEYKTLVLISYYLEENGLANYLLVLSTEGEVLLKEKIDSQLKGIGFDTFFILQGYVFFVKNKVELVSYKIV